MVFNSRARCRLRSIVAFVVLGCAATSCNSGPSTDGEVIETLELRIRELEAELENRSDPPRTENAEPKSPEPSSSVATAPPTTAPLQLTRETLAALDDCQGRAYVMVEIALEEGRLPEFISEDPVDFEQWKVDVKTLTGSCAEAGRQLELDSLQYGSHASISLLKERILFFNLEFTRVTFPLDLGQDLRQFEVHDWPSVQAFPGYLAGFLESYKNR